MNMACTNKIRHIAEATIKPIMVMTTLGISVYLALSLKEFSKLSETSFMVLLTMSFLISIILPNLHQLKSFSLTKGELVLQEVKETESNIKELALATVELVESGTDGLLAIHHHDRERYERAKQTITKLTKT
jgi:hypothetical protein